MPMRSQMQRGMLRTAGSISVEHAAPATFEIAYRQHRSTVTILMAGYNLRRMNRMYQTFEGDLLLPIILAEIRQYFLRHFPVESGASLASPSGKVWPAGRATTCPYRLAELAGATAIPRETCRRKVKALIARGWLLECSRGAVALSTRAVEHFGFDYNTAMLNDFLWTTDRLLEVLAYDDDALDRADKFRALEVALATRQEEYAASIFSTQFTPPPAEHQERLDEVFVQVAELLSGYWLRHLKRVRDAFGGDLLLPLLLGEVGHYNAGALMYRRGAGLATLDALLVDVTQSEHLMARLLRPCNAHSLSLVTLVPDSSVRRKLVLMTKRQWLARTPAGAFIVTGRPGIEFEGLNLATLLDFLSTGAQLRKLFAA